MIPVFKVLSLFGKVCFGSKCPSKLSTGAALSSRRRLFEVRARRSGPTRRDGLGWSAGILFLC